LEPELQDLIRAVDEMTEDVGDGTGLPLTAGILDHHGRLIWTGVVPNHRLMDFAGMLADAGFAPQGASKAAALRVETLYAQIES
jgi:hypothetical protein